MNDEPPAGASSVPTPDGLPIAGGVPVPEQVSTDPPASGIDDEGASDSPSGDPRAGSDATAPVVGAPAGLTLRLDFPRPTSVNRVSVRPAAGAPALGAGLITFSDGSSIALAGTSSEVTFPDRTVTSAVLVLEANRAASSVVWSVDRISAAVPGSGGFVVSPSASSNAGDIGALAFVDGDPASGRAGNEWASNPTDRSPTVTLSWVDPREITSVQILGPSATAFDPAYSAAASLYGTLVFDDGSRIAVSGIEGGDSQPTTIAFAPRTTRSVTLELRTTIAQANPGLREFAVFPRGVTPPRWPGSAPGYTSTAVSSAGCSASSPAVGSSTARAVTLVCPTPGAAVSGVFPVVVNAAPGSALVALAFDPASATIREVGSANADAQGRAVFSLDASRLMAGPSAVAIRYRSVPAGADGESLTVQFYNRSGVQVASPTTAPGGKTLVWDEQFRSPLSAALLGGDSTYGATKPAYWGPSEFGQAIFADPALGAGTLSTLEGEYLRIRSQPRGSVVDPNGWGRQAASGMLASSKVGATGFAAQYGYFEARILAPAGTGSWPAFWMLNSESAANRSKTSSGEVDAVELYGHQPEASCHALHAFVSGTDNEAKRCLFPNGRTDWSLSWHVYSAQIEPGGARYYIDGQEVARLSGLSHSDEPFYFMLNLALGGGYPLKLDRTGNTIDMYVDWVRVYT